MGNRGGRSQQHPLSRLDPPVSFKTLDPDVPLLGAVGEYSELRVYRLDVRERAFTIDTNPVRGCVLASCPVKDRSLVTLGAFNRLYPILIIDPVSREVVGELHGHTRHARFLYPFPLSSHGPDLLCSGAGDQSVRIWDVANAKEIARLKDHTAQPNTACCVRSRDWLCTGGQDHTIRIWDMERLGDEHPPVDVIRHDEHREVVFSLVNWNPRDSSPYVFATLAGPDPDWRWNRLYCLRTDGQQNLSDGRLWMVINPTSRTISFGVCG